MARPLLERVHNGAPGFAEQRPTERPKRFSKKGFEVQSQVCKIALKLSTDGRPIRKTEKNREIAEIVKGTCLLNFLSI